MYKKIYKQIKKWKDIFIFGHVRPDGDCLGSQFGLAEIIKATFPKKNVHVVGETSSYVSFLGTPEMENITLDEIKKGLAIVVDCGSPDRVSDMRYQEAPYIIKIDHHIPVGSYGNIALVIEEIPACAQIIAQLAIFNKMVINEKAAFALYTGLVTDTGRFRFRGVDERTFWIAGKLIQSGVDIEKIDNLLSVEEFNIINYKGYIYEHAKFTPNGAAYVVVTQETIKKYGLSDEEAASQVSLLGSIKGYPLWALVIEYEDSIRIRIRSRLARVDKLANKYGGGGHLKASGGKLENWEQLDDFVRDFDALGKYYNETGKDDLF